MPNATLASAVEPLLGDARCLGRLLDMSDRTVRRLNASGKLPRPVAAGKHPKWRLEEIRRWVEHGCPPRTRWEAMTKAGHGK